MIRSYQSADAKQVMPIWLKGNIDAHPFIPKEYWESNFEMVRQQLAEAEVYVFEAEKGIQGFIGLVDEGYIAGIFVDSRCRSCGIGRQLLDTVKQTHESLSLHVYQKNKRAVLFYLREGFSIWTEKCDEGTGEMEYTMLWERETQK